MSEELEWIAQVLDGNTDAFQYLIETYQTPIYNLAYRMLGNASEAEEAAQETFLKAYTWLSNYDRKRSFKTWLFSIASHHCIDRLRKRRLTWLSIDEPLPAHPALRDSQPGPEKATMIGQQRDDMQLLIGRLAPKDRIMVTLRYWYDYSYEEIAEGTDTTVSAVKSRLHRARLSLAKMMVAQGAGSMAQAALVEG